MITIEVTKIEGVLHEKNIYIFKSNKTKNKNQLKTVVFEFFFYHHLFSKF